MRFLRKGLDRLFGNRLVDWLQETAKNRYKAFLSGMVAGLISPSSSAIAVLSVQILNQSALTAGRMLEGLTPGQKLDTNFFDLLNCFRRINSHLTSVAFGIIGLTRDSSTGANAVSVDSEESWPPGEEGAGHRKSLPA